MRIATVKLDHRFSKVTQICHICFGNGSQIDWLKNVTTITIDVVDVGDEKKSKKQQQIEYVM